MHPFLAHHGRSWWPRSPYWLLAPVGLSVLLAVVRVLSMPDTSLELHAPPLQHGFVAGPSTSLTPLVDTEYPVPSADTVRFTAQPGDELAAPSF